MGLFSKLFSSKEPTIVIAARESFGVSKDWVPDTKLNIKSHITGITEILAKYDETSAKAALKTTLNFKDELTSYWNEKGREIVKKKAWNKAYDNSTEIGRVYFAKLIENGIELGNAGELIGRATKIAATWIEQTRNDFVYSNKNAEDPKDREIEVDKLTRDLSKTLVLPVESIKYPSTWIDQYLKKPAANKGDELTHQ